ncbi:MAG: Flagellar motor switch protein FliG [Pseudomonadales bacterium]|nr:Flagellar motor switch protein FliG [Pseudomonadales bacterium]
MTVSEDKQAVDLKPLEQAAILLLSVGEANAARILRHLGPKEVQKVGAQMASMADIDASDVAHVMERLLAEANTASGLGVGTESYIRNVLVEALGEERASTLIDQILMSDKTKGLEALRWMNPKLVANTIRGEHPQIQAVILSYLHPDQAAEVLTHFPDKARGDLLMRVATMESVNASALQELNRIVEGELAGSALPQGQFRGGIKFAADIMNNLESATEQALMEQIREADETLGSRIQDLMFVFDDLKNIDDQGIQSLLREVSSEVLVLALKAADEELKKKIFGNMSKRAGDLLREDLEAKGPVRVSDVENAQREILAVARRMADAGEISLGGSSEAMI